nr:MAG TPA: chromosome partitioning protein [Bacteriophage sp.]
MKKFQDTNKGTNDHEKIEDNQIVELQIDRLVPFKKQQPFSMYDDNKKQEVKESIEKFGVLTPIIVRPIDNEKYEIIAGHNRVECSKELGKDSIPAKIMNIDDDDATLIMIDTNLCSRDKISPIEKGRAYKLKLEILKKKTQELLDNSNVDGDSLIRESQKSVDKLTEETKESKSQIYRFISLTNLNTDFQRLVEKEEMAISVGSEVSTLNEQEQEILYSVLDDKHKNLKLSEIQKIKNLEEITYNSVSDILENKKVKKASFTGKLNKKVAKKYKDKFNNDNDFTNLIDQLLEKYFEQEENTL